MSYQVIPLLAGQPHVVDISGRLLLIDAVGVAGSVDVALMNNGTPRATMVARKPGFKVIDRFDSVLLTATVNTVVALFLSNEDVNLGTNQLEISNSVSNPVHVDIAGVIEPVFGTATIDNTDALAIPVKPQIGSQWATLPYLAAAVTNVAPAAVTAAASVFLAAAAARRGIRVKNVGANAVAIGGAGLTYANAAVLIQPGETWNENEAPGAAWSCICDAGLASTLNIQTIA